MSFFMRRVLSEMSEKAEQTKKTVNDARRERAAPRGCLKGPRPLHGNPQRRRVRREEQTKFATFIIWSVPEGRARNDVFSWLHRCKNAKRACSALTRVRHEHDDVADRALLAAGGHVDDLAEEVERRGAAAVQIERELRALVEEQLLKLRNARAGE